MNTVRVIVIVVPGSSTLQKRFAKSFDMPFCPVPDDVLRLRLVDGNWNSLYSLKVDTRLWIEGDILTVYCSLFDSNLNTALFEGDESWEELLPLRNKN